MKLNLILILILAAVNASARDVVGLSQTSANSEMNFREASVSLPPLGTASFLWLNSFSAQNSVDSNLQLSQFRWTPSLLYKISDVRSVFLVLPTSYAATSATPALNTASRSQTLIFNVSNSDLEKKFTWSYGFVLLDSAYTNRFFPLIGINYFSDDQMWQYSLAYPATQISYLGYENIKISFFFARESAKYFITIGNTLKNSGDYLETNHNILGVSTQIFFTSHLKLTLKGGVLFSSRYELRNSAFDKISDYKDYSGDSYVSLGLALDFNRR